MKFKLWSDLHGEFSDNNFNHIWEKNPDDAETILLLAGDISTGNTGQEFMDQLSAEFKHVIRICGNHEFYHHDFAKVIPGWKKYELEGPKNFHFLHNDLRIIDGVRILGGTMWTNFKSANPEMMYYAHRRMNDYSLCEVNGEAFTPDFVLDQHNEFITFLLDELEKPFDGKTVVITHHSPGNVDRRRRYRNDDLDYCYYANVEDIIEKNNIALWVHGHTHISHDYLVDEKTRVVCNPHGYLNYHTNSGFDKNLIIEI